MIVGEQGNDSIRSKQIDMALNWLDVMILGWLAVGAIRGIARGFVKTGTRIVGFLVAIAVLYPASQSLGGRLAGAPGVADHVSAWLRQTGILPHDMEQIPANEAIGRVHDLLAKLNLPAISIPAAATDITMEQYAVQLLLHFLFVIAIFLAFLGVILLIADGLGSVLQGLLGRLPLFGSANRLAGAVLGVGEHAILAAVVVGLLTPVLLTFPGNASRIIRGAATVEPLLKMFQGLLRVAGL